MCKNEKFTENWFHCFLYELGWEKNCLWARRAIESLKKRHLVNTLRRHINIWIRLMLEKWYKNTIAVEKFRIWKNGIYSGARIQAENWRWRGAIRVYDSLYRCDNQNDRQGVIGKEEVQVVQVPMEDRGVGPTDASCRYSDNRGERWCGME